jgi:hypothetical protein
LGLVTASPRSSPRCTEGSITATLSNVIWMWPASRSARTAPLSGEAEVETQLAALPIEVPRAQDSA